MPRTYSMDLRERVIAAMQEPGSTYESVAERFAIGRATVNRWLRRYRETGSPAAKKEFGRPPRALDAKGELLLLELVEERPDATLCELADDMAALLGRPISRATVGRVLRRLGITRKKSRSSRRNSSRSASKSSVAASSIG